MTATDMAHDDKAFFPNLKPLADGLNAAINSLNIPGNLLRDKEFRSIDEIQDRLDRRAEKLARRAARYAK